MTVERRRIALVWIGTLVATFLLGRTLPDFFQFVEDRPGRQPFDLVLHLFQPIDVSAPLFTVLYLTMATGLVVLARTPLRLLRTFQAFFFIVLLRMIAMYLVALEPPVDLIPLRDPISQLFYPNAEPFAKDLFYSGHVATAFLFVLAVRKKKWRIGFIIGTMLVAAGVVVQHVHWSVDVLAAPFAAFAAWRISGYTIRLTLPAASCAAEVA